MKPVYAPGLQRTAHPQPPRKRSTRRLKFPVVLLTVLGTVKLYSQVTRGLMKERLTNELMPARRKRGLSRKQVASLLGYRSISTVARLERGVIAPRMRTLLLLEILYRTPVAYLYPRLYAALREELRLKEGTPHRPNGEAQASPSAPVPSGAPVPASIEEDRLNA